MEAWPKSASSKAGLSFSNSADEAYYFTLDDLTRGFALVTPHDSARLLAEAWFDGFRTCIKDDRMVALTESFKVPALDDLKDRCTLSDSEKWDLQNQGIGRVLLRLSPLVLTLIAAENPDVRSRFDRYKVDYGYGTLDDPVEWKQMLESIKQDYAKHR